MAANANYAILNFLTKGTASDLSGGNLIHDGNTTATATVQSSLGVNSGKWYCEVYINTLDASAPLIGIGNGMEDGSQSVSEGQFIVLRYATGNSSAWLSFATDGGSHPLWGTYSENEANLAQYSSGNILMMALDVDNKKLWFGKNGTWYNSGNPAGNDGNWQQSWTGTPGHIHFATQTYNTAKDTWNFGQDDTFGGVISATGNADGNGFGVFKYAPPSGFLALCSANLPISDDIDPAGNDGETENPSKQMSTVSWTGTASSKAVTGVGFAPDMAIIKSADQGSQDWCLFDTTRGVQKIIEPNQSNVEETNSNSLTAFGTDGFTVGSDNRVNGSSYLMTAQCWKANGGTTAANSDGAISSVTQANVNSGFSIVTFTGLASSNFSSTVGHGLTKAPEFIIHKARDTAGSWWSQHVACSTTSKVLALDSTGAEVNLSSYGTISASTSSVFGVNGVEGIGGGGSARSYIAYCWHSVEGYSKFGSYIGNGNANGPHIYTGHLPRCVWIKRRDSTAEWAIYFWNDTSPNASYVSLKQNPLDSRLHFDAGSMNNGEPVDFLSNGFKIRDSDAILNASSGVYTYSSWGSVPYKYNNTF